MTIDLTTLDAHEQPSDELRALWKKYYRTDHAEFPNHPDIDELDVSSPGDFQIAGHISTERLKESFQHLEIGIQNASDLITNDVPIYFHPLLPGLLILPSLLPPSMQKSLLSKMIHRDLSNPIHQTNLHLHYDLPYRDGDGDDDDARSFFSYAPESPARFVPKDIEMHKPLSIKQVLDRRLSWVTLGGQYNWSEREYPSQQPPEFPRDIAGFLHTLFPETLAQAAIVNFYTPGDSMMMHRDVSEETDKGLVSISIGCDALFMIAPNEFGKSEENKDEASPKKKYLLLRLRSGDAIYMSQESRYAWHGVPKVLKGTCPDFLADWPAEGGKFEEWKGWMRNKRINMNVRQMR
ncbi:putative alkylated DNA repair protein [Rosellinia necatrix]|uniref:mRNA N(6)-methyladenine demethylase n=1 Tax=Rosellinia necatrix TaxID=77044 RepID=A0A1W2TM65_ROSNE|nr:putative alkylated DNA repair protein [Rosellinia necatrix]